MAAVALNAEIAGAAGLARATALDANMSHFNNYKELEAVPVAFVDTSSTEVWYRANPAAAQPVFRSTLGELFESSSLHPLGAGEAAVRQQREAPEPRF